MLGGHFKSLTFAFQSSNTRVIFPSDQLIFELTKFFTDDWKKILIDLGVEYCVIQNLLIDKDRTEVMRSCMFNWRESVKDNSERYHKLKKALEDSKRNDLVSKLTDKWTAFLGKTEQAESVDFSKSEKKMYSEQ